MEGLKVRDIFLNTNIFKFLRGGDKKMAKDIQYDYDDELDILHVYSEEINKGIKGCLSIGDFNISVDDDNKIVGMELEEASKNLRMSPVMLSNLDKVSLIAEKRGNGLFMGINVIKGAISSATHIQSSRIPIPA